MIAKSALPLLAALLLLPSLATPTAARPRTTTVADQSHSDPAPLGARPAWPITAQASAL